MQQPMQRPEPDVVMEGNLLKRGTRTGLWRERYFTLNSDSSLRYCRRENEDASKIRGVYDVSGCDVSDLYVEKYGKRLVYCLRVTFTASSGSIMDSVSQMIEEDDSSMDDNMEPFSNLGRPASPRPPKSPSLQRQRSSGKRRTGTPVSKSAAESPIPPPPVTTGRSVDNESLTFQTKLRHRTNTGASTDTISFKPEVPKLVEVEDTARVSDQQRSSRHLQDRSQEQRLLKDQYLSNLRRSKKRSKQKLVQGSKYLAAASATVGLAAVTAGVGLIGGLVFFGAAAASGGTAAMMQTKQKGGTLVIASEDFEIIKKWKSWLEAVAESEKVNSSRWAGLFGADERKAHLALLTPSKETVKPAQTIRMKQTSTWRPIGWSPFLGAGASGMRILREVNGKDSIRSGWTRRRLSIPRHTFTSDLSVRGKPCSPVKSHVVLHTSALDAFLCLMSYGCVPTMGEHFQQQQDSEQGYSFQIIESIDNNTDVIHLVFRPLFLFPTWTVPRDFVLYRYWRLEPDGTYVIVYESVVHGDCPSQPGYVRAEMHNCFTIAPRQKKVTRRSEQVVNPIECLMTAVAQVDPRGWVPTTPLPIFGNQSYGDAYGIAVLLQLVEIRDAIDLDRFVPVSIDGSGVAHTGASRSGVLSQPPPGIPQVRSNDSAEFFITNEFEEMIVDEDNYDFNYAGHEFSCKETFTGLERFPPPLNMDSWAIPDSNSFRIRGPTYLDDRKKINAGPSIGRLVAVDIVSVDEPIYSGMSVHPTERIQLALAKEATLQKEGLVSSSDMPPFVFVLNICVPGPPFYHAVFYYAIDDRSKIDGSDGTPSSLLNAEFFFGESDEFRHKTFKLIPQIVQGNFLVRKAVGSTPAVLGKKLRQLYVRHERFCEIILDCGSSPVATGVIRLSLGYAKTLVIDMGFVFEGHDESSLPERLMGCVRIKKMDFSRPLRHVPNPNEE